MPWVMVPVPEEVEEEFGHWLMRRTMEAALTKWPPGAVAEALDQADEPLQAMLQHLASSKEMWAPAQEVARVGGVAVDDLVEAIEALNHYCLQRSWPNLVMVKIDRADDGTTGHQLLMAGTARPQVLAARAR